MSAFAELGLREDADEPDIKRAYARRLRTTRPDEDAEGFQALNAAYKAALAAARWRAQAAADAATPNALEADSQPPPAEAVRPDVAEPAAPEPKADAEPPSVPEPSLGVARLGDLFPEHSLEEAPVLDVPEALFDYASAADNGAISFDFDAFVGDLFAVTADPEADLRTWLAARMASWPLAMKPTLAPYLLQALDDEDVAVSPRHFEILIGAFGLDDVLSHADPLAIAQLRAANEFRFTKGEAVARARRLLAPGNRRTLDKAVRVGGYPPFVAPMLARLVTGRGAAYRTGLRWIPFLARWVLNLLRYLSANAAHALSPPIEPRVLAKWQFADRTIGKMNIGHWLAVLIAPFFLAGMIQGIWDSATRDSFTAAIEEEQSDPEQAVRDYADFINAAPQPWTDTTATNVAIALLNRGVILSRLDRTEEAMRSYTELDGVFADYKIPLVRLQVAKGLVNMSYLSVQKGDYLVAIDYARMVSSRYSGANDAERGDDGFDLQIVKALNNQADASNRLGGRMAALILSRSVLDRFKDAKGDAMKTALDYTRNIAHEAETGADSPGPPTPAPPWTGASGGPQVPKLSVPKALQ